RNASRLRSVFNLTGTVLHTNHGRALLPDEAVQAVMKALTQPANLEFDLGTGKRGDRDDLIDELICELTGAEAATVVNNNAAAVLLSLAALARGREVLVSRGELVEIGGGFRVPEIMAESGARLVEVGTTNRTRLADYRTARSPDTALILKVHASNYRLIGFTEATPVRALAALGPPVMVDVGSGLLDETTPWLPRRPTWLHDEPGVRQALDAGAAVVTFSGDKLLGGPQAGVIVGRADLLDRIAHHPLARAVRADKMTLAALQAVAAAYLDGDATRLPLWRMAITPTVELTVRAEAVAQCVPRAKVADTEAVAGGGSLPGLTIPSVAVVVETPDPDRALAALRRHGVVARIDGDAVVCDLRTVDPRDDERLAAALIATGS
ncbi:MAG TPA: L-seryl-tRNA(Sec) selenium transferase, partial [Acidimicrobiia bacterium]